LSSIGAKRRSITRREAPDIEPAVSSSGVLKFAAAILNNNIEAQTEEGGREGAALRQDTVHQILHKTVLQNLSFQTPDRPKTTIDRKKKAP
jgi:hypothetical protein